MSATEQNHEAGHPRSLSVVIGLRDVYDQVQTLITKQASLDGKVDLALSTQSLRNDMIVRDLSQAIAKVADLEKTVDALNARPVVTPKGVMLAVGTVSTIVGVATAIVSLATR
jgi:hypothetical protein